MKKLTLILSLAFTFGLGMVSFSAHADLGDLSPEDHARHVRAYKDIVNYLDNVCFEGGLGTHGADCDMGTFRIRLIYKYIGPSRYPAAQGIYYNSKGEMTASIGCGYNNTDNQYAITYNPRTRTTKVFRRAFDDAGLTLVCPKK